MSFGQRALRLLLSDGERFVWQCVLLERSALIVPVDKETLESSAGLSTQPLRSLVVQAAKQHYKLIFEKPPHHLRGSLCIGAGFA